MWPVEISNINDLYNDIEGHLRRLKHSKSNELKNVANNSYDM